MREHAIALRGTLALYELTRWRKKGRLLLRDRNIITTKGRIRVAELVTGNSADFVDRMGIGDGGAPQSDLLVPIVPTLGDTGLTHELIRTAVTANVVGQVLTFTATFLTASLTPGDFINPANQVINEAGLFLVDDDQPTPGTNPAMFARKTYPSIPFAPVDRVGVIAEWELEVL